MASDFRQPLLLDGTRESRPDAGSLYEDLRAISRRSAAPLQGRELMADVELYDEAGLPA